MLCLRTSCDVQYLEIDYSVNLGFIRIYPLSGLIVLRASPSVASTSCLNDLFCRPCFGIESARPAWAGIKPSRGLHEASNVGSNFNVLKEASFRESPQYGRDIEKTQNDQGEALCNTICGSVGLCSVPLV
jgi:hypothetical protein